MYHDQLGLPRLGRALLCGLLLTAAACEPRREVRILSLSPEVSALIARLGAGERIVAADPESCRQVELPGALCLQDLGQAELLRAAALRPTLALGLGTDPERESARGLRGRGVRVELLDPRTVNEIVAAIHRVGGLLGREEAARDEIARMTAEIAALTLLVDATRRPQAAWILEREPLTVVGGEGLLHDILELAGAENAFHPSAPRAAARVEELATAELVLDSSGESSVDGLALPPSVRVERLPREAAALPTLDLLGRVRLVHLHLRTRVP